MAESARTRIPFAMPLSRDSFGLPIDKHYGIWHTLSKNIPDVLRMMKTKQRHLNATWQIRGTHVYCVEKEMHDAKKWILNALGLKQEADLIDFLGAELIKYMQSAEGGYDVSAITPVSIAVPIQDGNISHWIVDRIDFTRKRIYVKDVDGEESIYDIPQNITIESKAKIEDLHTYWATLLKAIGLLFFLTDTRGVHIFIEKLNAANNKTVVYYLAGSLLEIEVMHDKLTIKDDLSIQVSMTSISSISLPFQIEADDFLKNENKQRINPYYSSCYYNPTKKVAFIDTGNEKVPLHVDVRGRQIKVVLDEQVWIGITRVDSGTYKGFAFALYFGLDNKLKERAEKCIMPEYVVKYLFRRFGLTGAST